MREILTDLNSYVLAATSGSYDGTKSLKSNEESHQVNIRNRQRLSAIGLRSLGHRTPVVQINDCSMLWIGAKLTITNAFHDLST